MAAAGLRKRQVSGIALDHVGVVTRDLAALAAQYEHLGFTLTPLARQADGRIGNRCVMLRRSYIELLAVVDPNARSATLDRFLAALCRHPHLAFAIDDQQSALARLRRAGIERRRQQFEPPDRRRGSCRPARAIRANPDARPA